MNLRDQGNTVMSWTFLKTTRARQEWWDHGDKFTTLGLFDFLVPDNSGQLVGTIPQADLDRIARWPNTQYLLTVRNDGILPRFEAIVNNTGGAQDMFINELHRILDMYPFADGVDVDLEKGPNDNPDGVVALAKRIYNSIKARSSQRYVHWCLPPMTGDRTPFWERWCDYQRMEAYFDSAIIMSYAFAWSGSAPGPISPMWWMEDIYDYAITRIPPEKIRLGIVGFGFRWQIYRNLDAGEMYRGRSLSYFAALDWQQGLDTHHANQLPIPFAGYHDHDSQSPFLMLHIYDFLDGRDASSIQAPARGVSGSVGGTRRDYLITYEKSPVYDFQGILIDRAGDSFDEVSGAMTAGAGWIAPRAPQLIPPPPSSPPNTPSTWEDYGQAIFKFNVAVAGTYRLVVRVNAPWWDKQLLQIRLNGSSLQVGTFPDWYPLHRRIHWLSSGVHNLQAGENTLEVLGSGSQYGTQFWGFRVCSSFSMSMDVGGGTYTLMPRRFKALNGTWVLPANFILTAEVLRHEPEHAWVWYDDFRDNTLAFYNRSGGIWSIDTHIERRVLIQSDAASGDAQIHLSYHAFSDLNIRVRMRMIAGNGTMGIVFKAQGFNDLYLFLVRRSTQTAELWHRTAGTWTKIAADVAQTVNLNTSYTLRIRSRGNELRCWVGGTRIFNVTVALPTTGGFGIRTSGAAIECELLDAGDPYVFVPQEAVDIITPDGQTTAYGRIPRTGVTWLQPWEFFRYTGTGEEHDTRAEEISLDFVYAHTTAFAGFEDNRLMTVKLRDRGIWVSRLYLGDALGFSIVHYSDAEHFHILRNLAKHRWGLKGVAWWTLGLQDSRVFSGLPGS